MKKIILLLASIIGLSGCESLDELQSSIQNFGSNLVSTCGVGLGLNKFKSCPLYLITEDMMTYQKDHQIHDAFVEEVRKEYGSSVDRITLQFARMKLAANGYIVGGGTVAQYIPEESQKLSAIMQQYDVSSFDEAAWQIKSCRNFNETQYRSQLENQYGRRGAEMIEQKISAFKVRCNLLESANSPFRDASYFIELLPKFLDKWHSTRY
jgi:hypothetical protein